MLVFACKGEFTNATKQKNCLGHRQFFTMKTNFLLNRKQTSIKKCN